MQTPDKTRPIATLMVLAATAVVTAAQFLDPALLSVLERSPAMFDKHQYWRLFTALFLNAEGWKQVLFNFPAVLIVGVIVERIYGSGRWLILYFIPGIVGELAGYAWQPYGDGNSVAGAGLLGSMAIWMMSASKPVQARVGGGLILLGACALVFFRDLHGPPILAGASIVLAMRWSDAHSRDESKS